MTGSLKEIKNRIRSIQSTQKITHAMEMVSIAKLRAVENRLPASRNYFLKIDGLLKDLLGDGFLLKNPLAQERAIKKTIALCVFTSELGLCGVYNDTIIRVAENFINREGRERVLLVAVGRKGFNHFKLRGFNIREKFLELNGRYSKTASSEILQFLTTLFLNKEADEVYVAYAHFETLSKNSPAIEKILNITPVEVKKEKDFILEPDINGILDELIPLYLSEKIKSIMLNSFASEHSVRMMAMGEATKNADDLLDELFLSRNKLRQANITKEILEIVSSAEALR